LTAVSELQAFFFRGSALQLRVDRLEGEGVLMQRAPNIAASDELSEFPMEIRISARRMRVVFETLFCFENSVRLLIERQLKEAHGPDRWWSEGVPERIRQAAEKRRRSEQRARWHSSRGSSAVNFVDFPVLAEILTERWDLFEPLLADREWVESLFAEMNVTRRVIAHMGTLGDRDLRRLRGRTEDWLNVVG
jgi:hypothetical protein